MKSCVGCDKTKRRKSGLWNRSKLLDLLYLCLLSGMCSKRPVRVCNELSCNGWSERVFFTKTRQAHFVRAYEIIRMKWLAIAGFAAVFSAQAAPELCFDEAGRDYGIDPTLLMAISIQESRLNPTAINSASAGGTEDVCAMQLNSNNFAKLKTSISPARICLIIPASACTAAHGF